MSGEVRDHYRRGGREWRGVDVTKDDQVEAMFAAALGAFGRIDAVLNVAGIGGAGALTEVSMDESTESWMPT